jgi:RNA polymerase sigma-70 factor (sigma-E family)
MAEQADYGGFERLIETRGDALLRYGYALTGNQYDAADLVQEALARLRAAWSGVRHRDNPEAFVRTTMSRLHVSRWRKRRREHLTDVMPEHGRLDPALVRIDDDTGLFQALNALPRRQRAVLVLRYYEGLGDDQIAETLGISRITVRSHALGGLRTLWTRIADPSAVEPAPESTIRDFVVATRPLGGTNYGSPQSLVLIDLDQRKTVTLVPLRNTDYGEVAFRAEVGDGSFVLWPNLDANPTAKYILDLTQIT